MERRGGAQGAGGSEQEDTRRTCPHPRRAGTTLSCHWCARLERTPGAAGGTKRRAFLGEGTRGAARGCSQQLTTLHGVASFDSSALNDGARCSSPSPSVERLLPAVISSLDGSPSSHSPTLGDGDAPVLCHILST